MHMYYKFTHVIIFNRILFLFSGRKRKRDAQLDEEMDDEINNIPKRVKRDTPSNVGRIFHLTTKKLMDIKNFEFQARKFVLLKTFQKENLYN